MDFQSASHSNSLKSVFLYYMGTWISFILIVTWFKIYWVDVKQIAAELCCSSEKALNKNVEAKFTKFAVYF